MEVTVREARQRLAQLLNAVSRGECVDITRRGRVVARLGPPEPDDSPEQRRRARARLRADLPAGGRDSVGVIRQLRDERG